MFALHFFFFSFTRHCHDSASVLYSCTSSHTFKFIAIESEIFLLFNPPTKYQNQAKKLCLNLFSQKSSFVSFLCGGLSICSPLCYWHKQFHHKKYFSSYFTFLADVALFSRPVFTSQLNIEAYLAKMMLKSCSSGVKTLHLQPCLHKPY